MSAVSPDFHDSCVSDYSPVEVMKGCSTQVIEPQVKAYLYTWGEGRNTAEGEHIPVRIESLDIGYIDGQLLLPLIEEHTIDERSPLCGHTYMSLKSVSFAYLLQLSMISRNTALRHHHLVS